MLKFPWAGNGSGACTIDCFVSLEMSVRFRLQSSQRGTGDWPEGHRALTRWGLRRLGFSEVETGLKWTGQSWLAVPWQRPQPGSQEARNAGATDSVGLFGLCYPSAKWRGRRVCHVLAARGGRSHSDREAGRGPGAWTRSPRSAGKEAEAAQPTEGLAPPWPHVP